MAIETEVKLRLPNGSASARTLLDRLGYQVRRPRTLELDQLFDRPDGELQATGRALRLRSAGGHWTLTYKGPALPTSSAPHKSREEIELPIEDGAAMELILLALGYRPAFRYEKYRTVFTRAAESGVITLDETPIGDFFELEGPPDWIDRTTVTLGFPTAGHILSTYPMLYDEYCRQHPALPRQMMIFQPFSTP